ncbi:MAG TPA: hypothetical protein PKD26_09120 [Pyrinomonadaceae bacterium]|nr:hypothetical protein [Pyrinomonadaceae bacterium]
MTAQTAPLWPSEREKLLLHFQERLQTAHHLDRKTVSFQANKSQPFYRWFKYKEGFSSGLVKYFLTEYSSEPGRLLDPFAGSGTSLFAGQELGWEAHGIELLPVGAFAVKARSAIARTGAAMLERFFHERSTFKGPITRRFAHLNITRHAFPQDTEEALNIYLSYCDTLTNEDIKTSLEFAAFSILEQISYTRKDGQYLRWDSRSNRNLSGKPFDKGPILDFDGALSAKFEEILGDALPSNNLLPFDSFVASSEPSRETHLVVGSCLEVLPLAESDKFDFVITSPPYCNRYDYTRTYALELAFLGHTDEDVRRLRQEMLSCTVENKDKVEWMRQLYENINRRAAFESVMATYDSSEAMSEVNIILDKLNAADKLNNKNIARMVRNYFLEMCFVIYELARVTKPGGYCVMVNDNVRYGGEEIPADLILSEFAQCFGYYVESILVLPRGKGNSSQQMGEYGRSEIRKCVYVWRKA